MKTKTKLLCMSMLAIFQLSGADIYVNQSGQVGTYLTISDAVAAASDGDNIYISPIAEYIEDVTIDKSLTFASAETMNDYFVEGDMLVETAPGRDIRFIGGEFESLGSIGGTATALDRCKVTLRSTKVTNGIGFQNQASIEINILYCDFEGKSIGLSHGRVTGSILSNIVVGGSPSSSPQDTIFIIGNTFSGSSMIGGSDYVFIAGNKFLRALGGTSSTATSKTLLFTTERIGGSGGNYICNNDFIWDNCCTSGEFVPKYGVHIGFLEGADFSNFKIYNNEFRHDGYQNSSTYYFHIGLINSSGINRSTGMVLANCPDFKYNVFSREYGTSQSNVGYIWVGLSANLHSSNQIITENFYNVGAPTIDFYDINMTRNDIGKDGGPYAWSNYNSGTGPRIYHLEMPFQLLPGETPNIKAEAAHD